MSELVITRGYPGSGKTTFAREWVAAAPLERLRVNRDDLRANLYGVTAGLSYQQEQQVTAVQRGAVSAALSLGTSVIVDDTNLRLKHARAWVDLAVELGAEWRVVDIETERSVCEQRDWERNAADPLGRSGVGSIVIKSFADRYPMPWPEVKPTPAKPHRTWQPYVADESQLPVWIVDIDGTLAHNDGHRGWYDYERVIDDKPKAPVIATVKALWHSRSDMQIIVMSGRSDDSREQTSEWLHKHGIPFTQLLMRATGDNRADDIVKAELFDKHVRYAWNVQGVLDDRNSVVAMWRGMGLTCLQVAEGDF